MNSWMAAERKMSVNPRSPPATFCPEPSPPPNGLFLKASMVEETLKTHLENPREMKIQARIFLTLYPSLFSEHGPKTLWQQVSFWNGCCLLSSYQSGKLAYPSLGEASWHLCVASSQSSEVESCTHAAEQGKTRRFSSRFSPSWHHRPHLWGKTEWLEVRRGNRYLVFFFFFL